MPEVSNINAVNKSHVGFTVQCTTNVNSGTAYMVVVPYGETPPTRNQIILGQNYLGNSALANRVANVTATTITFTVITNLQPLTQYDIHVVQDISVSAPINIHYVDQTLGANIIDGSYSLVNRDNSGSDGNAYISIQEAINNHIVGYAIEMRDDIYTDINIDIPEIKNGSAWTTGNYNTLRSYPGEWAKIDGTGLNPPPALWTDQNIFTNGALTNYDPGVNSNYNEYWIFSNFEVTGGRCGFFMKMRHVSFRYMYIHDNGRLWDAIDYDSLIAGVTSVCPQYVDIQYCWFADNIQTNTSNANNSNILFDSDYQDDIPGGPGGAWDVNASTHHNIVANNYMRGSGVGFRHKNQQRLGLNGRDPNDFTYMAYGDLIHHNVILDAFDSPISVDQDFCQVYQNVVNGTILLSRPGQSPIIYNMCAYNNTDVRGGAAQISFGSIGTNDGYYATDDNFYDVGAQKTSHEHVYIFNNISDGLAAGYSPFSIRPTGIHGQANPDEDDSNLFVDRNLVHDSSTLSYASIAADGAFGGTDYTVTQFNDYLDTAQANPAGTTKNWDKSGGVLWQGATGTDIYKPVGTYEVEVGITIADGGLTTHPYLAVTPPAFIGAIDPNDSGWFDIVHDNVSTVDWLKAQP